MEKATDRVELTHVPRHIAIVMDGNGRWARSRGLPRIQGHRKGVQNVLEVAKGCIDYGVSIMTIYAFSTENWRRPRQEVEALMRLLEEATEREIKTLMENGIRLRVLGHLEVLPKSVQDKARRAIELSKDNQRLDLNVAFNYGGRIEILDAVRRIIEARIEPAQLTEELFSQYLYTAGLPDPDLVIRTAGEMRLSNFLIWQAAYAEYYSTPTYWPDFDRQELFRALLAYSQRKRRFGGLEAESQPL